jgi:hypothetical protein
VKLCFSLVWQRGGVAVSPAVAVWLCLQLWQCGCGWLWLRWWRQSATAPCMQQFFFNFVLHVPIQKFTHSLFYSGLFTLLLQLLLLSAIEVLAREVLGPNVEFIEWREGPRTPFAGASGQNSAFSGQNSAFSGQNSSFSGQNSAFSGSNSGSVGVFNEFAPGRESALASFAATVGSGARFAPVVALSELAGCHGSGSGSGSGSGPNSGSGSGSGGDACVWLPELYCCKSGSRP